MADWITVAKEWQTLIAGVLAIVAALIGVTFVYHQTRQTLRIERDRLHRRHAAARATLPLVLSNIIEYARSIGRDLRAMHLAAPGDHVERERLIAWEVPPIPQGETAALAEVIEAASNEVADVIADLLGQLQVQATRIRSLQADAVAGTPGRRNILKTEMEEYIKDIADIYARCELLFDYARREADSVRPVPLADDKLRALFLMGFHEAAFDRLKATIERRGRRATAEQRRLWRRLWDGVRAWRRAREE